MLKEYATPSLIVLAIILLFGIIGNMEILPENAEYALELDRHGVHMPVQLAGGF